MKKGVFITGTGTGVGKTFVSALLASTLRARGLDAGVMKPVESGCSLRSGVLVPEDAVRLQSASGVTDAIDEINPYRFAEPVSPNMAARSSGVTIDLGHIVKTFRELGARHDVMIAEGAGGLLTPLNDTETIAELIVALGVPVIIVAASVLGTVNHTLLTVEAATSRGIEIAGIFLNRTGIDPDDKSPAYNASEIGRITGLEVFGELPFAPHAVAAPPEGFLDNTGPGQPGQARQVSQKKAPLDEGGLEQAVNNCLNRLGLAG